jgi:hypothetical protein
MFQSVLGEIAEGGPPGDMKVAAVGSHRAGQHLEEGGLAGTVLTAETDAIPRPDVPVDAGKELPAAEIFDYGS